MSKRIPLLFSTVMLLLISSCQKEPPSEPVNQPSDTAPTSEVITPTEEVNFGDYYNESNFIQASNSVTKTKVVTYDGPEYLPQSNQVDIKVNDQDLFVYETRVNHNRKFAWDAPLDVAPVSIFDFEGKVHVEIKVNDADVTSAKVSPLVYGIVPEIKDNVISFDLSYTDNYVIEYNNDSNNAIHLFTNPIEENPITKEMADNDPSITYIGPGVYKADAIPVVSNSTIYIAGGAYVYGQIRTEGLENIKIKGRGIISGAIYNRRSESEYTIPVEIRSSKNIEISDITILDPAGWTIALHKSEDITLNNIKIITARQNGDGISVQSCKNVNVNGGFVRSWDDSLVVKNVERGTTKDVTFDGVTVWTDLAQSMEVGYETNGPTMDNVTFKNITIVHNFHKAAISLHNCDDAHITNVSYQNITLEDGQMLGDTRDDGDNDFLIDFTIAYNVDWTQSGGIRGSVDGVNIENVKVYSLLDSIVSRMNGESNDSSIKNVTIKGLEIEGKQLSSLDELKLLSNEYTSNITLQSTSEVLGAYKKLPYKLELATDEAEMINHDNISQTGMLVPEFAVAKGDLPYIGVAANMQANVKATHGAGSKTSTPADDGSGDYTLEASSASNANDKNLSTVWQHKDWKNEENEFAALTFDFGEQMHKIGVIRILGNQENDFYYTYSFQVWGRKKKSDGSINANYTRLVGLKSYEMTPGSGNCIDINITTQEYAGIQLRFYRSDETTACSKYEVSEVQFYPPSLTFAKAIVESSAHNDVYNIEKIIDGEAGGTSYYESKELPASFVIDLGDLYSIDTLVFCLPPSLLWDARTQEIEILYSDSNLSYDSGTTKFETLVEKTPYLFDPSTGNRNIIRLENAVKVRYIKVIISSNDIKGGYNAQVSEFSVYGE